MKFTNVLESNMIAGWEHQYLSYASLKQHINGALANYDTVGAERAPLGASMLSKIGQGERFMNLLNADLEKVVHFVSQLIADKNRQLIYIVGKALELGEQPCPAAVSPLLRQTQSVAADVVKIASFVYYNLEGFRKITKKYDKKFNGNCSIVFLPMVRNHACLRDNALDQTLIAISDAFAMIRGRSTAGSTWEPPESFERSTTKYLVGASDVVRVKLLMAEHLPILIVGREETTSANIPKDMLKVVNNTCISSVYFDDPELRCYHKRLQREEGARLFRLRWYGDVRTPCDRQQVFMERKTHHESWAVDKSVKERFSMKANDFGAFLEGQVQPTVPENLANLRDEIQAEILGRRLRPVVRTVYQRTAFQSSTSNEVRISIDTGLSFLDEVCGTKGENGWCRHIPSEGVDSNEIINFPWAVLEVKLTGGQPPWVETLLESGLLHEMDKFSKFSHGIATLYEKSGALSELPYWIKSIKCCGEELSSGDGSGANRTDNPSVPASSSTAILPTLLASRQSTPRKRAEVAMAVPLARVGDDLEAAADVQRHPSSFLSRLRSLTSTSFPSMISQEKSSKCAEIGMPKRPAKVEPKSFFANERTFIQWVSPVMGLIMLAMGLEGAGGLLGSSKIALTGGLLNGVGVLWMLFALYTYLRRVRKLRRHDSDGWDSRFGPVMLVVLLAIVCVGSSLILLFPSSVPTPATPLRAPSLALRYTTQRFQRGCLETPMSLNGVRPGPWEFQQRMDTAAFATEEQRTIKVRQWEAMMEQYVVVDKFKVEERVEHKFCAEGVACDLFNARYRFIAPNETYAIFKFAVMNEAFVSRGAAEGHSSRSKLEMNSYCERQNLGYSLYVADPLPVMSWTNSSAFDGLTRAPVLGDRNTTAQLTPVTVFYQTAYEYKLNSLFGADAKIVFQWGYLSESDRAFARDASKMEISVKLAGRVTLSAVRQAEGLLEAFTKPQ
jgi:SPX domain protein involved in polyphosphate accumulation/uncharacterized membrane protein YidH (DUF202 family)